MGNIILPPSESRQVLWTIQHEEAYREFDRTGVLRADENHLFCGDDLRFAYDWISRQMKTRIGDPPIDVGYPIWAWYQWEGKRKRRDQRLSGYAKRGTPLVQITFEADPSSFLLSDFDMWHIVLANQYVARSEVEWDQFYSSNPNTTQADVEPSWDRIFDLISYTPNWDREPEQKSIQATLWQIKREQVLRVEHFLAK